MSASYEPKVASKLLSIALLEKDRHGDVLMSWSYPTTSRELELVMLKRSNLRAADVPRFIFSKYEETWIYTLHHRLAPPRSAVAASGGGSGDKGDGAGAAAAAAAAAAADPFGGGSVLGGDDDDDEGGDGKHSNYVASFSVCVNASEFNPEKYEAMCVLLARTFAATRNPVKLLECYLQVFARGAASPTAGVKADAFNEADWDVRYAYLASPMRSVVTAFGEQVVLLWSALMLKKRIVVLSDKVEPLLHFTRVLPLFVFHRQNWNILRPYVVPTKHEVADLRNAANYVAGFTEPAVVEQHDLYDVFVDLNARRVTVAEHARRDMALTPFHNDLANALVDAAESANVTSDQEIVRLVVAKSKGLIAKLEAMCTADGDGDGDGGGGGGRKRLTEQALADAKLPAPLARFLYNVARAEDMA